MDYLKNGIKSLCCGCRACVEACPKKCIKMVEDEETFLYPTVDKYSCIKCGTCHKVCFVNKVSKLIENNYEQKAIAAIHKDNSILYQSSSGGAFSAIIEKQFTKNTVICGVCYNDDLKVVYDCVDSIDEYIKFKKSKYVLSNTNGVFNKVKNFLNDGKKVIFTGTPCIVAALKSFLGKDYSNLLSIDVVCHGAPSQKLFDKYLSEQKNKVKLYTFKSKQTQNNVYNSRTAEITYNNGEKKLATIDNDEYLKAYYTRLDYRPICAKCKLAQSSRCSDITLGDAWGIEHLYKELDPLKGVSLILINSEKGSQALAGLEELMDIYPISVEWAVQANEQLHKPTDFHQNRAKFFDLIKTKSFRYAVRKTEFKLPMYRRMGIRVKTMIRNIWCCDKG